MLFLLFALASSCCDEYDPTLKNLRICSINRGDLEIFECPFDLESLSNDAPFITASVDVYQSNPTDSIVFRLLDEVSGSVLLTSIVTAWELNSETTFGECMIRAAVSFPRPSDILWSNLNYNVQVTLENGASPLTIIKRFTIR